MNEETPKYMNGVAAELVGKHPQTLRLYETRGLVRPRRTAGGTRLRTALVVAQFALAIGMLIALLVAQQQYRHLQAAERHIDTDHVVTLWGLRWPEVRDGAQAFMREVRVLPGEGGLCAAPGTMVPVRITAADTYDLIGEVVGAGAMVNDALAARRVST
jgi:hypothetical protein